MIAEVFSKNDYFEKTPDTRSIESTEFAELLGSVLKTGSSFAFCAAGSSMHPLIRDGDVLTIAPLGNKTPCKGEVVAFVHPGSGRLLVHRVVGRKENSLLLKGDNCDLPDGLVLQAEILGLVARVKRAGANVRLGLGPERILVALLARRRRLFHALYPLWRFLRPLVRAFAR